MSSLFSLQSFRDLLSAVGWRLEGLPRDQANAQAAQIEASTARVAAHEETIAAHEETVVRQTAAYD